MGRLAVVVASAMLPAAILLAGGSATAWAQADGGRSGSPSAPALIGGHINGGQLATLLGNVNPQARPEDDQGPVADGMAMDHLLLQLQRSPAQEQALDQRIQELHDPSSPNYHHWLTAQQFGQQFGPAQQDVAQVVTWLQSYGMTVNLVYPSGMAVDVSATAGQIRQAFHTAIHRFNVGGVAHFANTGDPQIPAALAPVVVGFAALHDFKPHPKIVRPTYSFLYSGSQQYDLGPNDFAQIYSIKPLWSGSTPITGKGQTIVVVEDTDMLAADWTTFRSAFGLSGYAGTLTQTHPAPPTGTNNCTDPGRNGDEIEAALDAEWAGAVAPDAAIILASCRDSATFGGLIAANNLLNSSSPPAIISVSYGECESQLGSAGNASYNKAWQQAAAEGTTVFVAAGDEDAASCDYDARTVTHGIAVSGFASTPYNIAVGGTDFQDLAKGALATYWTTTNASGLQSAKSYIPEIPWNDSCAGSVLYQYSGYTSGLTFCNASAGSYYLNDIGGSGGPSAVYAKPSWQSGVVGIVNDGVRDIPDVSLFAGNGIWSHALLFCMSDGPEGGSPCTYTNATDAWNNSAGGTSFAAPAFAGIQALINQKTAATWGNANTVLYAMAQSEYGTGTAPNSGTLSSCSSSKGNGVGASCIFYDVTLGDNDANCTRGRANCYTSSSTRYGVLSTSTTKLSVAYPATQGWDFASGLGSVNVANLVNGWSSAAALALVKK